MKLSKTSLRHSNASQPTFHSNGGNSNSQLNYRQVKLVKITDHQENVSKRINRKTAYDTGMSGNRGKMYSSVAHLDQVKQTGLDRPMMGHKTMFGRQN